jgi:carbamoyl-phosphate synthase small subunit
MPQGADLSPTAALALADGTVFLGRGLGTPGVHVGELVFNTAMTGYQEILTDPSYAGQLVTFTFPHVGNVGANFEDIEAATPVARGMVVRADVTGPSSWRARQPLTRWLDTHGIGGIAGVDTRRITRLLRDRGAQNAALVVAPDGRLDIAAARSAAAAWPGLVGMDLVPEVTTRQRHDWRETPWRHGAGYGAVGAQDAEALHVVAIDYGIKRNILRELAGTGCRVTVVPATTTADDILALRPDGVFLSNGPGDPAATGAYAVPVIRSLVDHGLPVFGICLGHQMLGLAAGARTEKMPTGHHGANHPVKDLTTGRVEITSQNHGFAVADAGLPDSLEVTHRSLFDGTIQGLRLKGRPVFSVQYHPEASPGPQDSRHLFERFVTCLREARRG